MTDIADIISRLRCQHSEIARLAADAIENLVAAEAEAQQSLAELRSDHLRLLAQLAAKTKELPSSPPQAVSA